MNSKYTAVTILLANLLMVQTAMAAPVLSDSPKPASPTPINKLKQIEDLKDRLATKVAELRQTQRQAISGTLKAKSVSTATIETKTKDVKIDLTDEIKIYQNLKGTRTALTIDNLDIGDPVVVFGQLDTTLDLLKAKIIFIEAAQSEKIAGVVTSVDKVEFTLTVSTIEEKNYIVDIEGTTKALQWDQQNGITKGGFSKVTVGNTVHVLGKPVPKKTNRLSAVRILDIGNLSGQEPINASEATKSAAEPTVTPKPKIAKPTAKPTIQ